MRKRFLAGLLAAGMVLQSFSMPVYAAGEKQAYTIVEETAFGETEEASEEEAEEVFSESVSNESDGSGEILSESSESGETEETVSASEEGEENGESTPAWGEETESETVPVPEEDTESLVIVPEEEGTEAEMVQPDFQQSQEPMGENDGLETGFISGGEGVYQEGSFTVLGSAEEEEVYGISLYAETDFSAAEAYIYEQLLKKESVINVSKYGILTKDIGAVVFGVINDHPELYYARSGVRYSYNPNTLVVAEITVTLIEGLDDTAFNQAVNDAMSVIEDGMTEMEKAIALHEYIVLNCEYDYENLNNNTVPNTSYSAYGVMVNRIAVCQGYALAYKLLLNKAGIECYMVTSDAMNHAWNLIKLDGQYYQVDPTWDDPTWDKFGLVHHSYMFVSDEAFGTKSDVRDKHYGWVITKGSYEVNLTAEDTAYDNVFWTDKSSPLVLSEHRYYYVDNTEKNICMRNSIEGVPSTIVKNIDTWEVGNGYVYTNAFSGLFKIGDRLYFNTSSKICSVSMAGGDVRDETDALNSSGQSVYGSAFCQGKVQYVLYTTPNFDGKETIQTANLKNVTIESIAFDPNEVGIASGASVTLKPILTPSYASEDIIEWNTSDAAIATVSNGVVTAVGEEGSCTITAEADGKKAECTVTILSRIKKPEFSPAAGYIDQGESVTISADAGMDIYYTVDGSMPDTTKPDSTKKYENAILINEDAVIRAIAVDPKGQLADSNVAEAAYQVCINRLTLDQELITLSKGETASIGITELPTTKTEADVTWKSSNDAVVTVSADGRLTAVSEGSAVITAAVQDHKGRTVTATCSVTVDDSEYQVTFIGWDEEVLKTETVKAGKAATPPTQVKAPEGYEFTGWNKDYGSITQDITIEALFAPVQYTITYELDGGKNASANPASYTIETADIKLEPASGKEGFLFVGWYTDQNYKNKIDTIKKGSMGNITLYARWRDERGLWLKAEGTSIENYIPDVSYTGKAVKPTVEVYYGSTPLKAGTDYTISYKNNTAANLLQTDAQKNKAPTVVIKGKGNYAGTLTRTFRITPKSIALADSESLKADEVQADNLAAAYNRGRAVKPVPVLVWNGKKLSNKKDFTVEYPEEAGNPKAYKEPGDYKVLVKGTGNFTGTREITLTIADPSKDVMMSKVKIAKIPDQPYTGNAIVWNKELLKLTYGQETLTLNTNYTVALAAGDDGISAGTHVLVITGKGEYKGVRRVNFKIKGISLSGIKVDGLTSLVYNGQEQRFGEDTGHNLTITDKEGSTLIENRDYTLSFTNNKNAGTAKMTVTGKGRYTGKVTKTFKITPSSVGTENNAVKVEFENGSTVQPYEKGGAKPKVKVTFNGTLLEEGTDYTLSYSNHTSVISKAGKTPTVTVKGKKNFTGSRPITFTIKKKGLETGDISITAPDLEENTKAGKYKSVPVLTDSNGKKLKAGTDYEKVYVYTDQNGNELADTDNPAKGSTLTVTVVGKGNYEGSVSASFRILAKGTSISKASAQVNKKVYYTGEEIELTEKDITVKLGGKTLAESEFEIIGYSDNLKKGTAKVTIRGKGNYGGTKQISFKILSQNMKWWER